MKTKIDIRIFAIEKAVELLGKGTPHTTVISQAEAFEQYIIGTAQLPETDSSDTAAKKAQATEKK